MKKILAATFGITIICTALFAKGVMNVESEFFYAESVEVDFSEDEESHPHYEHYERFQDDSETRFLDRMSF